jgi:predicted ATPase/class 3 adenylate cyclase
MHLSLPFASHKKDLNVTDDRTILEQIVQLQNTIQTLEAQRAVLGDMAVDAAVDGLRLKIAYLEEHLPFHLEGKGERKLVTCLFCDVVGFTKLSSDRDPEQVISLLNGAMGCIVEAVHRFGGTINRFMGDGVFALFGVPQAYEDHAERAVRAGLAIQSAIATYACRVEEEHGIHRFAVRVGINSGLVVTGRLGGEDGEYTAIGDTVNVASRLEASAEPGTVLIGESTHRLVAPLFVIQSGDTVHLRGKSEPQRAYKVLRPASTPGKVRGIPGLSSPLVGRQAEFTTLVRHLKQLTGQGQGGVILVSGEAGLGKSRLVAEVRTSKDGDQVTWLEGHCRSYGQETYGVWLDLLRRYLGLVEEKDQAAVWNRLRSSITALCPTESADLLPYLASFFRLPLRDTLAEKVRHLPPQDLQRQIFRAIRVVLAALAAARPLVLLLEDLHWVDQASLDLIEALWSLSHQKPILIMGISRPEGGGLWLQAKISEDERCAHIALPPLSLDDSAGLVGNLLRLETLPAWMQETVLRRAEGNPFFVEELIRVLIGEGSIYQAADGWHARAEAETVSLPATLNGVLVSRIDRLAPAAKNVLQTAAVVGRTFRFRVMADLVGDGHLLAHELHNLQQAGLIQESEEQQAEEQRYSFKHALVQEAAYRTLLHAQRSKIHLRVAMTIETIYSQRLEEFYGTLAHHYTQAGARPQAVDYLKRAGDQARAMYANQEAIGFYRRTLALAKKEATTQQVALLHNIGEVSHLIGNYKEAEDHFREALDLLTASNLALVDRSRLLAETWRHLARTYEARGEYAEALDCLERGLAALSDGEDHPEERATLLSFVGWVQMRQGHYQDAIASCQHAMELAEDAQRRDILASAYSFLGMIGYYQGNYNQAIDYHSHSLALKESMGDKAGIAKTCNDLGIILYEQGEYDSALSYYHLALAMCQEIGLRLGQAMSANNLGAIHRRRGQQGEAIRYYQQALEICQEIGNVPGVVMAYNNLGQVYVDKGELEEALLHLEQAMELASACDDLMGTLTACSFLTEAYLAKSKLALALDYGQKSLGWAVEMGFRLGEAESRERLARIHARRGEMKIARQQWTTAWELFSELGHETMAQKVKDELTALDCLQEVQDV